MGFFDSFNPMKLSQIHLNGLKGALKGDLSAPIKMHTEEAKFLTGQGDEKKNSESAKSSQSLGKIEAGGSKK